MQKFNIEHYRTFNLIRHNYPGNIVIIGYESRQIINIFENETSHSMNKIWSIILGT
jgi:hypothetical protein